MAFKIFRRLADLLDLDETNKTAGYSVVVNATEDGYELSNVSGGGGGGAPTDATYITQTANASLSAEQALSSLATGVVKVTNGTGALSTAAEGTDYYKPGGTDVAVADGGTGASTAAGARTNLGLVIGTDVQAHDADLDTYAGISPSLNVQSVLSAADYAAIRTLLGLVIGTNVQAYDADLTTWAGLTPSAFFQTLIDDADAATARGTLGAAPVSSKYIVQTADSELSGEQALGALATGIVKNTTTTGVLSIATAGTDYYNPGGTDVALADGGTGASLTDPNADRILFWDDSAGQVTWLTPGTNLTITGTTIDAAAGGGGSATLSIPIDLLTPRTTTLGGNVGGNVQSLTDYDGFSWEFLKDVDGKLYGQVRVPADYASGGVVRLSIMANATTGVTRLQVGTKAIADGESMNPAALTDETAQDITVPGTAYLRKDVTFTLTETLAAGDILIVEVFHNGAHANDTLAVSTLLVGAYLEYST